MPRGQRSDDGAKRSGDGFERLGLEVFGGPAIRCVRTRGFASSPFGEFARSEPLT